MALAENNTPLVLQLGRILVFMVWCCHLVQYYYMKL